MLDENEFKEFQHFLLTKVTMPITASLIADINEFKDEVMCKIGEMEDCVKEACTEFLKRKS